jgi:hypothetical protein
MSLLDNIYEKKFTIWNDAGEIDYSQNFKNAFDNAVLFVEDVLGVDASNANFHILVFNYTNLFLNNKFPPHPDNDEDPRQTTEFR